MNEICKDCGGPIHWVPKGTEDGGTWYHDRTYDAISCPGTGMTEPAPVEV